MNVVSLPTARAPIAAPPVGQDPRAAQRELAPWPQTDRYPTVIGQGASLAYFGAVARTANVGYRQQLVDFLCELLEKDGHLFSVLFKLVTTVAGGRLEITPATLPPGASAADTKLAQDIADECTYWIKSIPDLPGHLATLAWSVYYGPCGLENHFDRSEGQWTLSRLSMIHSRRLAYPDQSAWDLYVWDQGSVLGQWGAARTNGIFGLRIADYPGKFTIHVPALRADYPTRDGLGRILASWVLLKLIASRGGAQYLETSAKIIPDITYKSDEEEHPRKATPEDIDLAESFGRALAAGTARSIVHPDSFGLELKSPDSKGSGSTKLSFKEWLEYCNGEESKVVAGSTLTTEVGSTGGNRALGQVHESGELRMDQFHANALAGTVRRDILSPLVRLNRGAQFLRLLPNVAIHVGAEPDPSAIIERAAKGAASGIPVDADKVAEQAGLPVLAKNDTEGRRMVPLNMVDLQDLDTDFAATSLELAKTRMAEMPPPTMPGAPGAPPEGEGPVPARPGKTRAKTAPKKPVPET